MKSISWYDANAHLEQFITTQTWKSLLSALIHCYNLNSTLIFAFSLKATYELGFWKKRSLNLDWISIQMLNIKEEAKSHIFHADV